MDNRFFLAVFVLFFAASLVVVLPAFANPLPADVFNVVGGSANGQFPVALQPGTEYEFAFDVFNESGDSVSIIDVMITLPTTSYEVGAYNDITSGLHNNFYWEAWYDADTATMSWHSFNAVSSAEMGDLQEGDVFTFSFYAVTDEAGTDGFSWLLLGDDNGATQTAGVFVFGGVIDDDDDDDTFGDDDSDPDTMPPLPTDDDDDTSGDDEGDDDDSDGGCGC
ncbi:MAG: hypothetical protein P9L99_18000 [Candidatus Lernaella stagnicola]|nr:hypothetical protein [Candidatus Lernaella stagnicola]